MATVDELIEQNKLRETPTAAEPEGGLLSRIESFIGGSTKPDTLDATGLTQADRRQSLFAGLTDIGAKLMAAGEPMWGHQRAQYLAGLGQVPANMQQMRSGIAQQKLLGMKGLQAQRELQVQRELDAIAKDPNHEIWKQFKGQDLALAQWAMRTGGAKGFMEFLARKDDVEYKKNLGIKALAEARKADAEAAGMTAADASTRNLFQPPAAAPPPAAVPPTAGQPSASVDPTDPATGLISPVPSTVAEGPAPGPMPGSINAGPMPAGVGATLDARTLPMPAGAGGMLDAVPAGPALTPPQQVLAANQPPSVQPTPAAGAILQGMQGAGSSEGPQVVEAPTATPTVPTPAPPAVPGQPPARVFAPGYNGPRTLEEAARQLPPAEQRAIMGMWPPQKRIEALNNHIDRQIKLHEVAQKAINDNVEIGPDGKPRVNQVAAEAQYKRDAAKAQAEADAQQTDRLRRNQEDQAETARQNAETQKRAQAVTATTAGQTTTGEFDPNKQKTLQQQKEEEAATKSRIETGAKLATEAFGNYNDKTSGPAVAASGGVALLPQIYEAKTLVKDGMLTGSFPEARQWLNRAYETLGLGTLTDAEVNRSGFDNIMGRIMLESLSVGRPLGSQVSNEDRKVMENIVGRGGFGKKELETLLDISERTAKKAYTAMEREITRLEKNHPELKGRFAGDLEAYKPPDYETWLSSYREGQRKRTEGSQGSGAGGFGRSR